MFLSLPVQFQIDNRRKDKKIEQKKRDEEKIEDIQEMMLSVHVQEEKRRSRSEVRKEEKKIEEEKIKERRKWKRRGEKTKKRM